MRTGKLEYGREQCFTLVEVDGFDNTYKGGAKGWIFTFEADEDPETQARKYQSHSDKAKGYLLELLHGLGHELYVGENTIDPNLLIGRKVMATPFLKPDGYTELEYFRRPGPGECEKGDQAEPTRGMTVGQPDEDVEPPF